MADINTTTTPPQAAPAETGAGSSNAASTTAASDFDQSLLSVNPPKAPPVTGEPIETFVGPRNGTVGSNPAPPTSNPSGPGGPPTTTGAPPSDPNAGQKAGPAIDPSSPPPELGRLGGTQGPTNGGNPAGGVYGVDPGQAPTANAPTAIPSGGLQAPGTFALPGNPGPSGVDGQGVTGPGFTGETGVAGATGLQGVEGAKSGGILSTGVAPSPGVAGTGLQPAQTVPQSPGSDLSGGVTTQGQGTVPAQPGASQAGNGTIFGSGQQPPSSGGAPHNLGQQIGSLFGNVQVAGDVLNSLLEGTSRTQGLLQAVQFLNGATGSSNVLVLGQLGEAAIQSFALSSLLQGDANDGRYFLTVDQQNNRVLVTQDFLGHLVVQNGVKGEQGRAFVLLEGANWEKLDPSTYRRLQSGSELARVQTVGERSSVAFLDPPKTAQPLAPARSSAAAQTASSQGSASSAGGTESNLGAMSRLATRSLDAVSSAATRVLGGSDAGAQGPSSAAQTPPAATPPSTAVNAASTAPQASSTAAPSVPASSAPSAPSATTAPLTSNSPSVAAPVTQSSASTNAAPATDRAAPTSVADPSIVRTGTSSAAIPGLRAPAIAASSVSVATPQAAPSEALGAASSAAGSQGSGAGATTVSQQIASAQVLGAQGPTAAQSSANSAPATGPVAPSGAEARSDAATLNNQVAADRVSSAAQQTAATVASSARPVEGAPRASEAAAFVADRSSARSTRSAENSSMRPTEQAATARSAAENVREASRQRADSARPVQTPEGIDRAMPKQTSGHGAPASGAQGGGAGAASKMSRQGAGSGQAQEASLFRDPNQSPAQGTGKSSSGAGQLGASRDAGAVSQNSRATIDAPQREAREPVRMASGNERTTSKEAADLGHRSALGAASGASGAKDAAAAKNKDSLGGPSALREGGNEMDPDRSAGLDALASRWDDADAGNALPDSGDRDHRERSAGYGKEQTELGIAVGAEADESTRTPAITPFHGTPIEVLKSGRISIDYLYTQALGAAESPDVRFHNAPRVRELLAEIEKHPGSSQSREYSAELVMLARAERGRLESIDSERQFRRAESQLLMAKQVGSPQDVVLSYGQQRTQALDSSQRSVNRTLGLLETYHRLSFDAAASGHSAPRLFTQWLAETSPGQSAESLLKEAVSQLERQYQRVGVV